MNNGIIKKNDTNEEYHASPLVGTSVMVSGYDSKTGEINLAKVKSYIEGMSEISNSLQKIFDYGSVQHSAILEQDLSQVVAVPKFEAIPGVTKKEQVEAWHALNENALEVPVFKTIPKTSKKEQKERFLCRFTSAEEAVMAGMPVFEIIPAISVKEQYEAWKLDNPSFKECPDFKPIEGTSIKSQVEQFKADNPALYYLSENEYQLVLGAFEVLASSEGASRMISNALHIETSFYDPEEKTKTRPDIIGETESGGLFVCNYKTISELSKIDSHIFSLKYDIRAMAEAKIIEKAFNKKVDHYYFLFQEKKPPFSMKCIELTEVDKEAAKAEYERIKNTVLIAAQEDYYPQPAFIIQESKVYRQPQFNGF